MIRNPPFRLFDSTGSPRPISSLSLLKEIMLQTVSRSIINHIMSASSSSSSTGVAAVTRLSTIQRHLSTPAPGRHNVERITVFGAGLMGAGIAQVAAQNGLKVFPSRLNGINESLKLLSADSAR